MVRHFPEPGDTVKYFSESTESWRDGVVVATNIIAAEALVQTLTGEVWFPFQNIEHYAPPGCVGLILGVPQPLHGKSARQEKCRALWDTECTVVLSESEARSCSFAMWLDVNSVDQAVGGLNEGRYGVDGDCALVFSKSRGEYFMLYKLGAKDAVLDWVAQCSQEGEGDDEEQRRVRREEQLPTCERQLRIQDELGRGMEDLAKARDNFAKKMALESHQRDQSEAMLEISKRKNLQLRAELEAGQEKVVLANQRVAFAEHDAGRARKVASEMEKRAAIVEDQAARVLRASAAALQSVGVAPALAILQGPWRRRGGPNNLVLCRFEGSTLIWADATTSLVQVQKGTLYVEIRGQLFIGLIEPSPTNFIIKWNDGDVWERAPVVQSLVPGSSRASMAL